MEGVSYRIMVTCDCGAQWEYRGSSGRTRCRQCRAPAYVPAGQLRAAGRRGATAPARTARARAQQPEPVATPAPPRAPAPRTPARHQVSAAGRPDFFAMMADTLTGIAEARAAAPTVHQVTVPHPAHRLLTSAGRCPLCATGTAACQIAGCPMLPG